MKRSRTSEVKVSEYVAARRTGEAEMSGMEVEQPVSKTVESRVCFLYSRRPRRGRGVLVFDGHVNDRSTQIIAASSFVRSMTERSSIEEGLDWRAHVSVQKFTNIGAHKGDWQSGVLRAPGACRGMTLVVSYIDRACQTQDTQHPRTDAFSRVEAMGRSDEARPLVRRNGQVQHQSAVQAASA